MPICGLSHTCTLLKPFDGFTCDVAVNLVKGKVQVLAIALLTCFFKTRSALQSWKWQLIGMS